MFGILVFGYLQLIVSPSNPYLIGVVIDGTLQDNNEFNVTHFKLRSAQLPPSVNVTFLLVDGLLAGNQTMCDWLDPSMVALMTIGTCTFQSSLTLVAPSDFPLPRFRLDLGGPCSSFSVDEKVFSLSSQHRFLPCALGDLLAHLQTNKILFVFSERYTRLARTIEAYLSTTNIQSVTVTASEVREHLDHNDVNFLEIASNTSKVVVALLTLSDRDELLAHLANAEYLLLFTDEADSYKLDSYADISRFLSWKVFMFHSSISGSTEGTRFHITETVTGKKLDFVMKLVSSVLPSELSVNTSLCNGRNISLSSAASVLSKISLTLFDGDGQLKADEYKIVTLTEDAHDLGTWNTSTGLDLNTNVLTQLAFSENSTIRVGTEPAPPFVILTENGTWVGFCIDMLEELALRVGFRYTIIRSKDNLTGAMNPDGSWSGLVGMAINNEIDIAVGAISVTAEREKVVDFTKPFMESAGGLLMRKFEDTMAKMFRTLMPFTFNVWMAIAGLVILVGIVFGFINRLSPSLRNDNDHNADMWINNVSDSVWVVFSSIMEQGVEMFPRGAAGRVVLGLWCLFTILVTASYTANLAAFLTFSMDTVPINSIYDLTQQSRIKPLVKNGTNLYSLFQKGETEVYRKIWEMLQESPIVSNNADGLDLVMRGPYAYLTDREQLDLMQHNDCRMLVQGQENFNINGLGFFVQEGSELLEPLSNNIIKLMEAGLINKWRKKWWSSKDVCLKDTIVPDSVQSLELDSTAGPFILYAAATVFAGIILLLERAHHALRHACKHTSIARSKEISRT